MPFEEKLKVNQYAWFTIPAPDISGFSIFG
jgi:hypothetical protein